MALEIQDWETKVVQPTQQLLGQFQIELVNWYFLIRQGLIDFHDLVAAKSIQWYDSPISTTQLWYQQAQQQYNELYTTVETRWIPQMEELYKDTLATTTEMRVSAKEHVEFVLEHPEQVTAEVVESMTSTLTSVQHVSEELVEQLQNKSAEILQALIDHPLEMMETASVDALNALMNEYFVLVTAILNSL